MRKIFNLCGIFEGKILIISELSNQIISAPSRCLHFQNLDEDGGKKFWQARGRGGKEAREEQKRGSNQQAGADCLIEKLKN